MAGAEDWFLDLDSVGLQWYSALTGKPTPKPPAVGTAGATATTAPTIVSGTGIVFLLGAALAIGLVIYAVKSS